MRRMKWQLAIILFQLVYFSVSGQSGGDSLAMVTDTSQLVMNPKKSFWQSKGFRISVVPVGFFASSALVWNQREEVRKLRNRYIPTFEHHYDNYMQYVPAVAVLGLNAAGVKGKHTMKRAFVSYAFSAVIMGITVNTIKYTAKVERPDGSSKNSFPSGHTANSFMNATWLHKEYGQYRNPLYSVAGYTAATATAIGRQLNNRHWVSDVLAGAGIGILSTELGYLIADKVFKEKGNNKPLRMTPFPVDNKPSFIEMRLGFATATSNDLNKKLDGLKSKNGFNMGLEGAWFFHKNIGIGGEFAFTSFPINSDGVIINDPEILNLATGVYTQPMGIRYLQIGPYFSLPLTHNWFITGKLNAGSSVGAQGQMMLELNDEFADLAGATEIAFVRYKPEHTFSWSAGAGIQKRIGRNTAIKLYTSYFASDHDFELDGIDTIDDDGNITYKPMGSEKVKFDHFVFGLGLTAFLW